MRKLVFQMMTTLNGRMDDPDAWVSGISDDLYADIDQIYSTFDTLLIGHTSYNEIISYWPTAGEEDGASPTVKSMAHKMNTYKKYVFSKSQTTLTPWNNVESVVTPTDEDVMTFINQLKSQSGGDIHLVGGASFVQSIVRLGLVDEYHLFVYPVVSAGAAWFDQIPEKRDLELLSAKPYQSGVVSLFYKPKAE